MGDWPTNKEIALVAASDASEKIKASAEYVCPGTADQTKINTAITDA